MTEPRGQRTGPASKPPVIGSGWLDPRQDTTPQHTCEHPAATPADIGRRWRCTCGKTWRAGAGWRPREIEWLELPPNPGRPETDRDRPEWMIALIAFALVAAPIATIGIAVWLVGR